MYRLVPRLVLSSLAVSGVLMWADGAWRGAIAQMHSDSSTQLPMALTQSDASSAAEVEIPFAQPFADDDIPEEILRTEIITGARSPLTGEMLSAAEYAQLQAALAAPAGGTLVRDDIRYLIFLLQFRRAIRPIVPFL